MIAQASGLRRLLGLLQRLFHPLARKLTEQAHDCWHKTLRHFGGLTIGMAWYVHRLQAHFPDPLRNQLHKATFITAGWLVTPHLGQNPLGDPQLPLHWHADWKNCHLYLAV